MECFMIMHGGTLDHRNEKNTQKGMKKRNVEKK